MDINIGVEANREIEEIVGYLLDNFPNEFSREDESILCCKYKGNSYYLTFYPKLIFYGYGKDEKCEPWICCRFDFEGDEIPDTFLSIIVETFKQSNLTPFYDEDAYRGYWRKRNHKGWYEVSCYVNPSYPEGKWENHTL